LASARHLHYSSFFLHTGLRPHAPAILRQARALGLTTSIDPNWDSEERWGLTLGPALPYADLVFPNEQEALRIADHTDVDNAAAWFQAQGVRLVAVKRGADGAVAYGDQRYARKVKPAPPGGDGVGAGDSFDAGFLAGWLRGLSIQHCLEIGCDCGRAVASAAGGLQGQPTWQKVAPSPSKP
jgi:sugar/nucleoside kinase (ribokinase family)